MDLSTNETTSAISTSRQWLLVGILTAISMLAMIDKNLIQLMVDPIRRDIGLSEVQISVLIGAAFAVANLGASLPAGWLADRSNRPMLIGSGVIIWSLATAATGLAQSFVGLFAARAAVGIGEGLIPPACYSLLRDGVAPFRRGRALSIYTMATSLGSGFALVICGALIAAIAAAGIDHLPIFGAFHPWQLALFLIGVAGLPLVLSLLFLPAVARPARTTADHSTYRDALDVIAKRWPVLGPLLVYSVSQTMLMATMGAWVPALIGRKFGLAPQQLGPILGAMLMICGPSGLLLVGIVIDRLNRLNRPGAAVAGLCGATLFGVTGAIMPQIGSLDVFWVIEVLVLLMTTSFLVVMAEIVSREAPAGMVGKVMAVFLVVQAIIGSALAPTATAFLSQYFYAETANPLGNAISTSAIFCGSISVVMIALVWRNTARSPRVSAIPEG